MKNIETQIDINVSTHKLWNVLMDFSTYPDWNPFLISIKGLANEGSQLNVDIQIKEGKNQVFKPTVIVHNKDEEFRWLGHLFVKGLFDGEHYFLLKSKNNVCTTLTHGENFSGLLSKPILELIKMDTINGFSKMNQAIKLRAESLNLKD